MGGVDGFQIVVAGLLGLVTGVAATLAFRVSEHQQRKVPEQPPAELDPGVVRVLAILRSAAVVLGPDNTVIRASPPAYALGVVRDDTIAHPAIQDMIDAVRRDGVIADEELELPRGPVGRGRVMLQVRVAHIDTDHIAVLAEDRTEARRIEAIRRDFAVNVSHELKTPVGAISLLAETMQDAADDPDAVRHFAGRMQQESTRLAALVHEIIELSRLQVAGALPEVSVIGIDAVIDEAADRARVVAAAKDITLSLGGESGLTVYGDHALLVTAVRNLLDNAVAYSGTNTRVGVGVSLVDGLVEIAVVDQGIGIPKAEQSRVFERFYRVDPARSRDTGGTGLGLSIVKHVAADHGGDVKVWSEPGRGSTFTLRIPAAPPGASMPDDAPPAPQSPPAPAGTDAPPGSTDPSDPHHPSDPNDSPDPQKEVDA